MAPAASHSLVCLLFTVPSGKADTRALDNHGHGAPRGSLGGSLTCVTAPHSPCISLSCHGKNKLPTNVIVEGLPGPVGSYSGIILSTDSTFRLVTHLS